MIRVAEWSAVSLLNERNRYVRACRTVVNRFFKVEDWRYGLTNGGQGYDSKDEINLHIGLSPR